MSFAAKVMEENISTIKAWDGKTFYPVRQLHNSVNDWLTPARRMFHVKHGADFA